LPFLVAGGIVAGLGQGSSFRHGLAAINEVSPLQRRGEIASGFFAIAYLGISLPIVGVGLVAEVAGLRAAGLLLAAVVDRLAAVAARYGTTPGAVAAAWTLRNPAVDGAIVGFRRPDQVEPILAAVGLQLTDAEAAQIEGAQERRAA